jgi:processing peptidase subunit beta
VHVRDDDIPTTHISGAVEAVSWSLPNYYPMLVMQSIFGNWDRRALGSALLLSSRLSDIIARPVLSILMPSQLPQNILRIRQRHS